MILGILSDTHGKSDAATRAIELLLAAGAEYLIHCGDVGGESVLDALTTLPAAFVFGNNDYDRPDLIEYANAIGVTCLGTDGVVRLAGRAIAVTHGDMPRLVSRYTAADAGVDYLLTGHSHVPHDQRVGRLRWINPGALYRATPKTVATLDLATDTLTRIVVPGL